MELRSLLPAVLIPKRYLNSFAAFSRQLQQCFSHIVFFYRLTTFHTLRSLQNVLSVPLGDDSSVLYAKLIDRLISTYSNDLSAVKLYHGKTVVPHQKCRLVLIIVVMTMHTYMTVVKLHAEHIHRVGKLGRILLLLRFTYLRHILLLKCEKVYFFPLFQHVAPVKLLNQCVKGLCVAFPRKVMRINRRCAEKQKEYSGNNSDYRRSYSVALFHICAQHREKRQYSREINRSITLQERIVSRNIYEIVDCSYTQRYETKLFPKLHFLFVMLPAVMKHSQYQHYKQYHAEPYYMYFICTCNHEAECSPDITHKRSPFCYCNGIVPQQRSPVNEKAAERKLCGLICTFYLVRATMPMIRITSPITLTAALTAERIVESVFDSGASRSTKAFFGLSGS